MGTVRAPYPSRMDTINNKSVVNVAKASDGYLKVSRRNALPGVYISNLLARNPDSAFVKAISRIGSFDFDYRDVLIPMWYRTSSPNQKLPDVASLGAGNGRFLSWSPDGQYVSMATLNTPHFITYKRSGDTFTKITDPTSIPGVTTPYAIQWSPDGKFLGVSSNASPYFHLYQRSGDTLTQVGTATTLFGTYPWTGSNNFVWSPDGLSIIFAVGAGGVIATWTRPTTSSLVFSRQADLNVLPANISRIAISPDGKYLVVGLGLASTPYMVVYQKFGGVWTQLADAAQMPASWVRNIAWAPDSKHFATALNNSSPTVNIYRLTPVADDLSTVARVAQGGGTSPANGISFSPDGKWLAIPQPATTSAVMYELDLVPVTPVATFIAQPYGGVPAGTAYDSAFSPDGKHLAFAHDSSPFITIYKSSNGPVDGIPIRI